MIGPCLVSPCDDCVQPFVVGAVPIKTELIDSKELHGTDPQNPYAVLEGQWKAFMDALQETDDLVVAGYSLPDDDAYGRFLIQEAIARRSHRVQQVYFYAKADSEDTMALKLKDTFHPSVLSQKFAYKSGRSF